MAAGQLAKAHVLIIGVSQQGVTKSKFTAGIPLPQACHTVQPYGCGPFAHRLNQDAASGVSRSRRRERSIGGIQPVNPAKLTHVGNSLSRDLSGQSVARCARRRIGNHVTRHTARNLHRVQALTVVQALRWSSVHRRRALANAKRQGANCVLQPALKASDSEERQQLRGAQ